MNATRKPQPVWRLRLPRTAKGFQSYMIEAWEWEPIVWPEGMTPDEFRSGDANIFARMMGATKGVASSEWGDGMGAVWSWPSGGPASWIRDDGQEVTMVPLFARPAGGATLPCSSGATCPRQDW